MFKRIVEEFNEGIIAIADNNGDGELKKADLAIPLCNASLSKMQALVEKEDFENSEFEISFFKNVKVIPMSYLIYYSEIKACELQMPKAGVDHQIKFLEKEIKKINKFFSRNSDFVHYMELGSNYMDHQYFTRNHRVNFPVTPTINYYQYPEFSTSHDMLWAKIQAMYKYIHYIRESMQRIKPGIGQLFSERKHKLLLWTASKTDLIEMIYALYANRSLNHGTAELGTIASSFEDYFNIKIDNVYKTYSEIKARKGSKTKFLNELTIKLQKKIIRDDEQ